MFITPSFILVLLIWVYSRVFRYWLINYGASHILDLDWSIAQDSQEMDLALAISHYIGRGRFCRERVYIGVVAPVR